MTGLHDVGMALDDVAFNSCPLPRATQSDECPANEWRCGNKVTKMCIFSSVKPKYSQKRTKNQFHSFFLMMSSRTRRPARYVDL